MDSQRVGLAQSSGADGRRPFFCQETYPRFPRLAYRFVVDGVVRSTSFPPRLTADDGEALAEAALRSAGLVVVADYLVERLVAEGRLVRLLREFELPPVPISVVHLPTRNPSPAARALTALLRRLAHAS